MAIVLDLVQNIVLHKAYEFTCAAAQKVFNIYTNSLKIDNDNSQPEALPESKYIDTIEEQLAAVHKTQVDESPEVEQVLPEDKFVERKARPLMRVSNNLRNRSKYRIKIGLAKRDIPRFNSGPIDPPLNSSMCLCRDSYFS